MKYKSLFSRPEMYGKLGVSRKKILNQQIFIDCYVYINGISYMKDTKDMES